MRGEGSAFFVRLSGVARTSSATSTNWYVPSSLGEATAFANVCANERWLPSECTRIVGFCEAQPPVRTNERGKTKNDRASDSGFLIPGFPLFSFFVLRLRTARSHQ